MLHFKPDPGLAKNNLLEGHQKWVKSQYTPQYCRQKKSQKSCFRRRHQNPHLIAHTNSEKQETVGNALQTSRTVNYYHLNPNSTQEKEMEHNLRVSKQLYDQNQGNRIGEYCPYYGQYKNYSSPLARYYILWKLIQLPAIKIHFQIKYILWIN